MEAKDTIMTRKQTDELLSELWNANIRNGKNEPASLKVFSEAYSHRQVEISFRAGIKAGYNAGLIDGQYTNHKRHGRKMVRARQEGKEEGIREVVESFDDDICSMARRFPTAKELTDFINKWQAKLKEWR